MAHTLLLFFVFLLGVLYRVVVSLYWWKALPELYLLDGKPLIQNPDGYYFARVAEAISEGTLSEYDPYRSFPEGMPYTKTLYVYILGYLAKLTNLPLIYIDLFLTPVLASAFVFPMYLFFSRLGLKKVGLLASLFVSISPVCRKNSSGHAGYGQRQPAVFVAKRLRLLVRLS